MKNTIIAFILCFFLFPALILAHPGQTDSSGGHTNKKTGEYHYHNGGGSSSSSSGSYSYSQPADVVSIQKVQVRLTELGYDPGPADGIKGAKTIAAIKQFQRDNNLTDDGVVGQKTRDALRI